MHVQVCESVCVWNSKLCGMAWWCGEWSAVLKAFSLCSLWWCVSECLSVFVRVNVRVSACVRVRACVCGVRALVNAFFLAIVCCGVCVCVRGSMRACVCACCV